MEYLHIFRDETSNGRLSSNTILSGVSGVSNNQITKGANNVTSNLMGKFAEQTASKFIVQPLNQVTGGFASPAFQLAKTAIFSPATLATTGVTIGVLLAFKGIEYLVNEHQKKIAKLESEARAANDKDNLMIRSGSLNISGATISYNRFGRAQYKFDRS